MAGFCRQCQLLELLVDLNLYADEPSPVVFSVHVELQDGTVVLICRGHDKQSPHFEQLLHRLLIQVGFVLNVQVNFVTNIDKNLLGSQIIPRFLKLLRCHCNIRQQVLVELFVRRKVQVIAFYDIFSLLLLFLLLLNLLRLHET